ncbi:zinc-dependent alcohol dehydrogenase [Candidatus Poriferisocius sp.]|uniref:zinc-dependent alcohol dehydrogenase n=1 Tax=Candidatus Poriferisocius sp. TaxID=3101276 RepID=UPI003B5A004D
MRAAQLTEPGVVEIVDVPMPDAGSAAIVRMQTLGLCGTDVSIVAGKIPVEIPRVMGHEGVGVIELSGPSAAFEVGQRVLINPGFFCEHCHLCGRGCENLCPEGGLLGRDLDGLFTEYTATPERQLLAIPDHVPSDAAGVIQVLGTCVHAVGQAPVSPGDTAVVIGLGVSGQLITQLLVAQGAHVVGVTRSEWKRELALQQGAVAATTPERAAALVEDLTEGRGPETVFEAVGTVPTFALAIELAGSAATVVFFGTAAGSGGGLPYYQLYYKELTLRNPRGATTADYERAIALVADGTINGAPLISWRYGLDEINQAIAATKEPSTLKILMELE